jgi:pimeloyl-ACP methyl ester carboxylesterase
MSNFISDIWNSLFGKTDDSPNGSYLQTAYEFDEIHKANVNGVNLAFHTSGEGETVLFIHGITTYSFLWREIAVSLSQNYNTVTLDLLGCGDSDMPLDVDYSLKNHAELVKSFIEKLGLGKVHLVGHDLGGGISQILMVKYPELFCDVTLINTVGYNYWPVQPISAMRTPIVRQLAMASLDAGTYRLIVKRGLYYKKKLNDTLMELFWRPLKRPLGRKAFLHFAKCLNNKDLLEISEGLTKVPLNVMIIRGEADEYLTGAIADKLNENIPSSKLIKIADGGHFIQFDVPEKISGLLSNFFNREKTE